MPILKSSGALRRLMLPLLLIAAVPAALAQLPTGAVAQPSSQPGDPAELLAAALRTLAVEPNNLQALTAAGRNALVLGDPNAAVGFFGRAQEIAPRDGRVKAGLGSALVQLERPQDALRLFAEASRQGVPDADIAEDRGLAYDLTGDPKKAQRDYAMVLAAHPEDDTARRRLALSQGISGDKVAAIATLDPLIRKRDIAGWRAQTFVLAMTGDAKGASDITHVMLPQQADMMQPFLVRLATLSPADKARAVHFGEMPASGRAYTPTQVASVDAPATYAGTRNAAATTPARSSDLAPVPARAAMAASTPAPQPAVTAPPVTLAGPPAPGDAPLAGIALSTAPPPPPAPAADVGLPTPSAVGHYDLPHVAADRRGARPAAVPAVKTVGTPVVHGHTTDSDDAATKPSARKVASSASDAEEDCVPAPTKHSRSSRHHGAKAKKPVCTVASGKSSSKTVAGKSSDTDEDCVPAPATHSKSSRHHGGKATKAKKPTCTTDSKASSKASESKAGASKAADVDEDCVPASSSRAKSSRSSKGRHHAKPSAKPTCKAEDSKTSDKASSSKAGSDKAGASKDKSATSDAATDCTPVKAKASTRHKGKTRAKPVCAADDGDSKAKGKSSKAASDADGDGKTKSGKASTHGAKPASDDDGDSKSSRATGKSERVYVQVAGGANKADMEKAWAGVKKKAPDLMKGHTPSTTPLRATNRLLIGPFKDEDEAQAFVNKMAGKGLSGFVFKSGKGQKVEKVDSGK